MKRKFLASLLALCMVLTAVPGAWAAEEQATEVDLNKESVQIDTAGEYTVGQYEGSNTLTIAAEGEVTVTLLGVNIEAGEGESAISIERGNVTLIVDSDSTLTGGDNGAGIYVAEGASLTIQGEGKLTAVGNAGEEAGFENHSGSSGASGIGGTGKGKSCGDITIDGATVVAEGYGTHGFGIGASGTVGEIQIINNATVTAYGGFYAGGKGTELQSDYGKRDPEGGAAIGGGKDAVITIADGNVTAYGGSKAAGIGANYWNDCSVTISGDSVVEAQGGSSSAGIGTSRAGNYSNAATITITGGKVTAKGGDYGAGIGGGYNGNSRDDLRETSVTITGGEIEATGGMGGAAIGGGYKVNQLAIEISNATVTAVAGGLVKGKTVEEGGAPCAIGSGANGSGKFDGVDTVDIDMSSVNLQVTAYEFGKPAVEGMKNETLGDAYTEIKASRTGKVTPGYTKEVDGYVRVWGEGGGNASKSFEVKLYSDKTLMATTSLNNVGNILDGDVFVTWNFYYPQSADEYWTTTWEEGHPNSANQPNKVELYIDGEKVAENTAQMNGPDDLAPVIWRDLGGVKQVDLPEVDGTYTINTLEELEIFRDSVNAGNSYSKKTVKLATDIDLKDKEWTPIGNSDNKFQGTFDGDKHTISNLVITGNKSNVGFFGYTTGGAVKNLTIENAKVSGRLAVGVVAGTPYTSKYSNITVTGHVEVNGFAYVGGVGGRNAYANWENITVNVDESSYVMADSQDYRTYVGGVIGFMGEGGHTFKNITSNIDVTGSTCDVGGITGIAHYKNKFIDIICSGDVTVLSSNPADAREVGGIAGVWFDKNGSPVEFENLTFTGTVSAPNADIELANGGLIGDAYNKTGNGNLVGHSAIADGKTYETLAAAIEAAKGEVALLRDVEENVTIPEGKTITLDLNGCTLNGGTVSGKAALTNDGTVTIKDTGRNGTIQREDTAGSGSYYTILNNGTMTIESGIVKNDSGVPAPGWAGSSLICNGGSKEATLTINGGEIAQDNFIAVKNDEFGTLVVNGGTISSETQAIQNWKDATINDGELTGQVTTWTYKQTKSLTQIKGGQFDGEILASKYGDAAYAPVVTITAGYFTKDPSAYVAAGFAVLKSDKAGYDYEVRKPGMYTVTYVTAHGEAPAAQTVTETLAGAAVVTLPNAPAVEGYTFLGWVLEGETYAAGAEYTVTKDVTFTAKWAENVDTPVVDEEVVILPSAPEVSELDTDGKSDAEVEAMEDMAEALQQPGAVEVEGLTDAAKDEIRDAAAAADKNEAFQKIVEDALAADPDGDITTTIVLEPYMDIQVKDAQVDGDKIAVELELTPRVRVRATIAPENMTEENTVELYTQELTITETVEVTLPLPDVFDDGADLFVKHVTDHGTYYYSAKVKDNTITFETAHGFGTFTLVTDDRRAEVQLGDILCTFVPSDVGMSLDIEDAYDAPRGEYFVGWKFDGISGVHDTLTDELLTKLAAKYSEDGEAVQAKPVFDEKSSGGSVDRGYAIRVEKTENGKVTAPSSATAGSTVTIKVKPDAGYQLDELVVTDRDGDELKLTDKGNGKFTFKMPKSKVTVEATFVEIDREPEVQELPFVDVADTAYYADAVRWAVAEGITGGTSAATFSPNAACTRAQAVTFLWRAAGSPVVNYAMGFTDVPADAYYAEAVRWAVSQGITTGATETTFAPDAPCTRAQIVTFIYRNVKAQGGGFTGSWMFPCPFTDVSADAYYFESVQWCVMKGITEGATETTFAPDATCTRAQIVTFLYRGAEK